MRIDLSVLDDGGLGWLCGFIEGGGRVGERKGIVKIDSDGENA